MKERNPRHLIISDIIKPLLLLCTVLIALFSSQSYAVVTCAITSPVKNNVVPLAPANISAGQDMPNGTVIYEANIQTSGFSINCTSSEPGAYSYNYSEVLALSVAPLPISNYATDVYTTDIPGVGVKFHLGKSFTLTSPYAWNTVTCNFDPNQSPQNSCGIGLNYFRIQLIKIGSITPGTYNLSTSLLPTVIQYLTSSDGSATFSTSQTEQWAFTGQLAVNTQTCTTPDVNVDLGTYDISNTFTGVNSATPWVDSSITLTNCPTFYGYYNSNNAGAYSRSNSTFSVGAANNNQFGLILTPNNTVINSANAIMAVSSSTTGSAATGVGIQLWQGESGTAAAVPFNQEKRYTLPNSGVNTVRVPLVARYIQTSQQVTPGRADGKVTFTINYY
ncbi:MULTISPECIES: fimbrial protein [unclassified Serratia (in: enterobacteria)]|uniref:fimbrial protein n=1 Tax=unclassified Serratia (in: enterobacteria) TaxID=2647522 RepID=UPI0030764100